MDLPTQLLQVGEDAHMVDAARSADIFSFVAGITSPSAFLRSTGGLNGRFIRAVLSSCMIPTIIDTALQHRIRGLVADAVFSAGELMTLWDAVPYHCWQRTPRERSLIRQMMRSVYIEYDQDTDVGYLFVISLCAIIRSTLSFQYICRLYPMSQHQWEQFPQIVEKIFNQIGDVDNWRSDSVNRDVWNACDHLDELYAMMTPVTRMCFTEFEEERHLVGINPNIFI